MGPLQKLRLKIAGRAVVDEAADRQRVSTFIAELRRICEAEGPWAFARLVNAPEDADVRQIAYLLVWNEGPGCEIWGLLERFDAVDLAVDAAVEGFDAFLAVYPTKA